MIAVSGSVPIELLTGAKPLSEGIRLRSMIRGLVVLISALNEVPEWLKSGGRS